MQDFFSRLDGPIATEEFKFGYHALDCYAVTPKDDVHGGRPCVQWKDHKGACVCNKVAWREAWKCRSEQRFEIPEIMHECEDSEYSAERANTLYKKFDKSVFPASTTLTRRDCYEKAQDLLRLLVPAPHKFEPPPAGDGHQSEDSEDDQDDQDQDDPGDEEKTEEADKAQRKTGPSSSPWEDWTGGAASGSWNSSSWQWRTTLVAFPQESKGSQSGANKRRVSSCGSQSGANKRRVSSCGFRSGACSSQIRMLTTLALPALVQSMHPVLALPPPVAGTLGSLSLACSVVWYFTMSTAGLYTLKAVPEMVEGVVEGVEEVVSEAVRGTRDVVRAISVTIMIIACIAAVRVGCMFLRMIFERTHRPQVKDKFARRYGGRLLGGMNAEPVRNLLTVNQALGLPPSPESRPPAVDTQVDPARLNLGDHFSFVYNKGARAGERRTVTLHHKVKEKGRTSLHFICWETQKKGVVKVAKLCPSLTTEVTLNPIHI